jgi:hypothetical protein
VCLLAISAGASYECNRYMAVYVYCSFVMFLGYELVVGTIWNGKEEKNASK